MAVPAGAPIPAIRPGDDSERLGAFFDRAIGEVYPYLFRRCGHDRSAAEDLTQETFATAVEALRSGRLEKITVGWLITCAQSRFIDHCRREARNDRHLHALPSAAPEPGPETLVIADDVVTELLGEMPASQRLDRHRRVLLHRGQRSRTDVPVRRHRDVLFAMVGLGCGGVQHHWGRRRGRAVSRTADCDQADVMTSSGVPSPETVAARIHQRWSQGDCPCTQLPG